MPKIAFELLIGIGRNTKGPHVEDLDIKEGLGIGFHILYKGLNKVLRLTAGGTNKYPIPPMYVAKHLVFRDEFIRIDILPLCVILGFFHDLITLTEQSRTMAVYNKDRYTSSTYIYTARDTPDSGKFQQKLDGLHPLHDHFSVYFQPSDRLFWIGHLRGPADNSCLWS
jgi:hypothetical protein